MLHIVPIQMPYKTRAKRPHREFAAIRILTRIRSPETKWIPPLAEEDGQVPDAKEKKQAKRPESQASSMVFDSPRRPVSHFKSVPEMFGEREVVTPPAAPDDSRQSKCCLFTTPSDQIPCGS
jgi:hypothetical protein